MIFTLRFIQSAQTAPLSSPSSRRPTDALHILIRITSAVHDGAVPHHSQFSADRFWTQRGGSAVVAKGCALEAKDRAIKGRFGSAGEPERAGKERAGNERAGKRKGWNTQGTSHAGMATTPTFQNCIYFSPQKAEIVHKCRLPKTLVCPPKYRLSYKHGQTKQTLCPQNPFCRLFPSRIESSFHTFYPEPFFVQHLAESTDDFVHLNDNEFRAVNPRTTLNPDTLNPWTTLNPDAQNP